MGARSASRAVFTVTDPALARALPHPFGPWTATDAESDGPQSFDVRSALGERGAVWRIRLPADVPLAFGQLEQAEAQLAAVDRALEQLGARLAAAAPVRCNAEKAFVAVGRGPEATPPEPERELQTIIASIIEGEAAVSFGPGAWVGEHIEAAAAQVQSLLRRLPQLGQVDAAMVTQLGDRTIARTSVGWSGDASTVWRRAVTPQEILLHQRAAALALASRTALLRLVTVTASGAAGLAVRLVLPGGPLLALPLAWTFVREVLGELAAYRA